MMDLYTARTPNGQRVSIMMEETGFKYNEYQLDLMKGEQYKEDFINLNPSHRIPVLVDYENATPLVMTQSIAILQYLAEKSGQYLPVSIRERVKVYEWMSFHAVDIASTLFNAFYLKHRSQPKQIQAAKQLQYWVDELYPYFDLQLKDHEYLAGGNYSIADISAIPVALAQEQYLKKYENLTRWIQQLKKRPAIRHVMKGKNNLDQGAKPLC